MILAEGKEVKGGVSTAPKTKRPSPPEGQGRKGPDWKTVKIRLPYCPRCGWSMDKAQGISTPDLNWRCSNFECNYVC